MVLLRVSMRRGILAGILPLVLIALLVSPSIMEAQPVTTEHEINVNRGKFDIRPLLIGVEKCNGCAYNRNITVLKKEGNFTLLSVKYLRGREEHEALVEIRGNLMEKADITIHTNGTKYQVHVRRAVISSVRPPIEPLLEAKGEFPGRLPTRIARSMNISLISVTSDGFSMEYYQLDYSFRDPNGKLVISTMLVPQKDVYISAFTLVRYTPVEKRVTSLELVNMSNSIRLSEVYKVLGDLAGNLSKYYERGNKTVREQLGFGYSVMARELRHLSNIVHWMGWIDKPIMNAKAVISDLTGQDICTLTCGWTAIWHCFVIGATTGEIGGVICSIFWLFFCWYICTYT
ncbi:MAG: hypothetical protein ACP5KE_08470 [Candidatus Methanodesulfokora sp.]